VKYNRNNILNILPNNRFLELLSKPLDQRSNKNFREEKIIIPEYPPIQTIIGSINLETGEHFNNFVLTLPNKSTVIRNRDNSISIITKRFTIILKTMVDGRGTFLPKSFIESYLNIKKNQNTTGFIVSFVIEVKFNFSTFYSFSNWQYYKWIDSFYFELEEMFSQDYFFQNRIGWDKAYSVIKAIKNMKKPAANILFIVFGLLSHLEFLTLFGNFTMG
jgi:hypothetical protein